jgi:cell division protease FtsH
MSTTGIILCLLGLLGVNALLVFNDLFRRQILKTIKRLITYMVAPFTIWLIVRLALGDQVSGQVSEYVLLLCMTLIQAAFFSLFQIFLMFWAMGRPQVEWFMPEDIKHYTWDDWIGEESIKDESKKMVKSLTNWKDYEKEGATPANAALIYGPPGTGKSHLAKVIASQVGLPCCIISSASLNGPFVAMGMLIVKSVVRQINKRADVYGGCVAFFDEIDAIGAKRGTTNTMGMIGGFMGGAGGSNGALQTLLTSMSGASSGENWLLKMKKRWGLADRSKKTVRRIQWLAATNIDPDHLDDALVRSGRFGSIRIYIGPPNGASREKQFHYFLRNKNVANDIEYQQLVQLSRGMSGADIETICDATARTVIYERKDGEEKRPIQFKDLWREIRIKKWGLPSAVVLSEEAKWSTAVHEAGHAIAVVDYPPNGQVCAGATLRPRENFLAAVFRELEKDELVDTCEEDCFRAMLISVNSRPCEELVLHAKTTGVTSDFNQATTIALNMVELYGMGEHIYSRLALGNEHSPEAIEEAKVMVDAVYIFAKKYSAERKDAAIAMAQELRDKIDMTGPEVIDLVKSVGKQPSRKEITPHIRKIMADLKRKKKQERSELLALARARRVSN